MFGPVVTGDCRSGFDFTLYFEQSILSLLPSTVLLFVFPWRLSHLLRQDVKAVQSNRLYTRLIAFVVFAALQIALLIEWASPSTPSNRMSIPAASLRVVDAFAMLALSAVEYRRSVQPSTVLNIYLLFSLLFDAVQLRTLWLMHNQTPLSAIATASLATKAILLILEARNKRMVLRQPYRNLSPESVSGILTRGCFWWLNPLLWQGFRTLLSPSDMFQVDSDLSSEFLGRRFLIYWTASMPNIKFRLLLSVARSLKRPIFAAAIPRIFQSGFTWCQPFLIFRVIDYVGDHETEDKSYGYGLIAATALIYTGLAFSSAMYRHKTFRMITMVRGGLISVLYDKTLKLNMERLTDSAAMTLMTTDIDSIATNWINIHEIWASPIDVGMGIYLLQRKLGIACIAPVALALFSTIGSTQIAKMMRGRQESWLEAVQRRVSLTSSLLTNIRGLKMMALAVSIGDRIRSLRSAEITKAKSYLRIECLMNVCANTSALLSPVATLLLFAFVTMNHTSDQLTSSLVYYTLTIVALMSSPLGLALNAFPTFLASLACFARIQKYLLLEEKQDYRDTTPNHRTVTALRPPITYQQPSGTKEIELSESITIGDDHMDPDLDIPPFSFSIRDGCFGYDDADNAVLKDICWECQPRSFTVILGPVGSGKTTLLKALLSEVKCFKGSVSMADLSVSYCGQDVWLRDLSLRDNILGGVPFDQRLYKEVLFATCLDSEIAKLPQGDLTRLGSKAVSLSGGQSQRVAVARAIYARKSLILLDDSFSGLDTTSQSLIHNRLFGPAGLLKKLGCTVVLVTHSLRFSNNADSVLILDKNGGIHHRRPTEKLELSKDISNEDSHDPESPEGTGDGASQDQPDHATQPLASADQFLSDDLSRQKGDLSIYKYYLNSVGILNLLVYVLLNCLYVFCTRFGQVWVGFWVDAVETSPGRHSNIVYGCSYVAIMVGGMIMYGSVLFFMFQVIVPRSARRLHSALLEATIRAPYSFHAVTDPGITLNRFSQDITLVDIDLPSAAVEFFLDCFTCLGQAILICTGVKYLAAFLPAVIIATYMIQKLYLRTSRQVRFLDLEAKSPLFSQMLETYSGILTIRAHGWEHRFKDENLALLDKSQRPYYALYCIQRWLSFVLSLLVAVVSVILVTFGTQIKNITSGNAMGAALINVLNFAQTLSLLISAYTTLETSLGAVGRIKSFTSDVRPEDEDATASSQIPQHCPRSSTGKIEFISVTASYSSISRPALDRVSGKSSLILALLKMLPLREGAITIDGVNISTLSCDAVRSICNTIPQAPVIFPGSIRQNLDPALVHSDAELQAILESLELWGTVSSRGGLDAEMDASPFSHGQKQLICIGRSFLMNGKKRILIVDEFTSGMDQVTETLMLKFLEERFSQHTILAVTHRLNTVNRYDRIAVFESGRLVEWGEPVKCLIS
ncbi:ABC transporter-like protein [Aspergillus heteromorphus CBS 117.55]|uniref:ABC transporter-like protein n=1 Tax=Aspergillus heteromorphus CBS 117.55 TaxID=1448321 RepID=A0A317VWM7_9EURO|nr:ABC transporter-like protein [Aspergillus heteromorphus CBS 117.55]PWY77392.1 ABC transporter-like protein [Aspergillus heteromorphus CBS 117.55]